MKTRWMVDKRVASSANGGKQIRLD